MLTFLGIRLVRLIYRYDQATSSQDRPHSSWPSPVLGYTGTVTPTDTGSQLIVDGADVGVGVTYQLPKISFQIRNSALDVKFDTQGTAAQMYNFSAGFTSVSHRRRQCLSSGQSVRRPHAFPPRCGGCDR